MMKRYLLPATPLAAMLLLTGCMDDKYDLSNIDTTTQVSVNGLVLPVNLDPVKLDNMIDIKDGDDIQKTVDPVTGKEIYAYTTYGDFNSDKITINPFGVNKPTLTPDDVYVKLKGAPSQVKRAATDVLHYENNSMSTSFSYDIHDIDEAVKRVDNLTSPKITFDIKIQFPSAIMNNSEKVTLETFHISFPKHMVAKAYVGDAEYPYDPTNGIVTISEYDMPADGLLALEVIATLLPTEKADGEGTPVIDGAFEYTGDIVVEEGGEILITPKATGSLDADFYLKANYDLQAFDVVAFSGALEKPLDGMAIDPISLASLPDFLTENGTNIMLSAPQLYLSLTNPVSEYEVKAVTGLTIKQERSKGQAEVMKLDNNLVLGYDQAPGTRYNFVLSPLGDDITPLTEFKTKEEGKILDFSGAKKELYSELSNILAGPNGEGVPDGLDVSFSGPDPVIEGNKVKNFPLHDMDGVEGDYLFYAPLALEENSVIYYSGTKDDWSSEALDRLHVQEVRLAAVGSSNLPVDVTLKAQIINKEGKHLGECEPIVLTASSTDEPIEFIIKAADNTDITDIDGVYYHASLNVSDTDNAGEALSPDQEIILKDVKAKINGYYLYEDK